MKDNNTIHEAVVAAIREGRVTMKPRWYFVLRGVLAVLGGVIAGLLLLYVISLIIYMLRQTGVAVVPLFGLRGWFSFMRHLPWLLVLFSLIFVLLLEILVRRYSFAYWRPLFYSAVGIVTLVIVGGFLVASTSLHPRLMIYAQEHRLPFGARFYRSIDEDRLIDIYRGQIIATSSQGFILRDRQGTSSVIVTRDTRQPSERPLMMGDFVVIFGDAASDTITAIGVHRGNGPMRMK